MFHYFRNKHLLELFDQFYPQFHDIADLEIDYQQAAIEVRPHGADYHFRIFLETCFCRSQVSAFVYKGNRNYYRDCRIEPKIVRGYSLFHLHVDATPLVDYMIDYVDDQVRFEMSKTNENWKKIHDYIQEKMQESSESSLVHT